MKFKIDSILSLGGNLVIKLSGLIITLIIARILGNLEFGKFSLIKSTIVSWGLFSTLGQQYLVVQKIASCSNFELSLKEAQKSFSIVLTIGLLCGLVFSPLLIWNSLKIDFAIIIISISILIGILSWSLINTVIGLHSGLENYKKLLIINTIYAVLSTGFIIFLTLIYSLEGAVISLVWSNLIWLYFLMKKLPFRLSFSIIKLKDLRNFDNESKWVAWQEISYSSLGWITIWFLSSIDYGELGVYNVLIQISSLVVIIPSMMRNVMLTYLGKSESSLEFKKYSLLGISYTLIIAITIVIIILVFKGYLFNYFGDSYKNLETLLKWGLIWAMINSVTNILSQIIMAKNENRFLFKVKLFRDIGILIIFVISIYTFRLSGSFALIISQSLFSLLFLLVMIKKIKKETWV